MGCDLHSRFEQITMLKTGAVKWWSGGGGGTPRLRQPPVMCHPFQPEFHEERRIAEFLVLLSAPFP
jgi:hypothetical protein